MRIVPFILFLFFATSGIFSQTSADEQAIRQVVQTIADAWTAGSGEQFASVFAEQHDFVVWNGYYLKGLSQQQNAEGHQRLFEFVYKDTDHYATVDKIRFLREDLALIHVFAAVVPKGEGRPKDPDVLWSGVLEKKDGLWKILSFHNLDLEVFQDEQTRAQAPMPPEVMYASWYAAAGK